MSRARIDKLEALLARVERRRAEPRLVSVGVTDVASNTNIAARAPTLQAARAEVLRASTPSVATETLPSPRPKPMGAGVAGSLESLSHLSLDHPSRRASSLPPPPVGTADTLPKQAITPPPPSLGSEPPQRAATEVLPATPERIAPQPTASTESAVQVVSAPRIDAPRSFADLLSLSLSLRPR